MVIIINFVSFSEKRNHLWMLQSTTHFLNNSYLVQMNYTRTMNGSYNIVDTHHTVLLATMTTQCDFNYPQPFGYDVHMGIPDKWNSPKCLLFPSDFKVCYHKTASWYHKHHQYYSCKYTKPSVTPGYTPRAMITISPNAKWPYPPCMCISASPKRSVQMINVG